MNFTGTSCRTSYGPFSVHQLKEFDRITRSIRSVISNSRRNINYTDSNLFSDLTHRRIES